MRAGRPRPAGKKAENGEALMLGAGGLRAIRKSPAGGSPGRPTAPAVKNFLAKTGGVWYCNE